MSHQSPVCPLVAAAALLRMSATEGHEAGAAGSPAVALFSAAGTPSATVDLAELLSPPPGSVSVNGPRRQRRGWGPVPGSAELPRRSLSAMETSCPSGTAGSIGAQEAPRPHSVQGFEQPQPSLDAFSVYQDACSAQGTPPGQAEAAFAGSARSRRLSFSFGGGPRPTAARGAAKVRRHGAARLLVCIISLVCTVLLTPILTVTGPHAPSWSFPP